MDRILEFIESTFDKEIRAKIKVDKTGGDYCAFPDGLNPALIDVLREEGIGRLYSHQGEAFDAVSRGENTLLVSRTASGKTLSFFLPILNEYMTTPGPFTTLLLYPTKALSRDQETTFGRLMERAGRDRHLGTFDGDTPRDERERIQRSADFIITNPDMLHNGILPNNHRRWKNFLSRLRYIVVDEVHNYRGAFGSHVSNVMRRLLRVCTIHGADPLIIGSSATIGNPGDHARALFHREFTVIDRDGAPKPDRYFYFINPAMVQSQGHALYRRGTGSVSVPLIREAARAGVRTICFCGARQEVERLYRAVVDGRPELAHVVKPYRGGLLPEERRQLERDLFSGKLKVIISTNALELGIDVGDLDLCILSGHPGTLASFWQQAGRVGRKGSGSAAVFIARDNPIDQYLVHHPEFVTSRPVEEAWLSADNPYILLQHIPCAAQEFPLRECEPGFDSTVYHEAVRALREEKTLVPFRESLRYGLEDYPARGVNLRGMTDYNVEIYCGTEVIGEIDPIGARGTLYRDAIYQHLGRRFMSMELDLEKKLCRVEPVDVDYYTEAVWEGRLEMTDTIETGDLNGAKIDFGYVNVNKQPKLYKKIRERSFENIGFGPITLPPFIYDTTGLRIFIPREWRKAMKKIDIRYIGAALFGLGYVLRRVAPGISMADVRDIQADVSYMEDDEEAWKSALFLYDAIEGGVGYAEKIYDKISESLSLCLTVVRECECDIGCPSCVPPLPPGISNESLESLLVQTDASLRCTESLLAALTTGVTSVPVIRSVAMALERPVEAPPRDLEKIKLEQKISRASAILKAKRERLH